MTKITIKEIAKLANVSVSSVSRALNDDPNISAKTKQKIDAIIEKYHYRPSSLARGMVSKKTNRIAIIVSDITNPYFNQFVSDIEEELLKLKYTISLFDSQTAFNDVEEEKLQTEISILNQIQSGTFDAVIILGGPIDRLNVQKDYLDSLNLLANDCPILIVGRKKISKMNSNISFIYRNQKLPVKILMTFFLQKNYQSPAFIGGNPSSWITKDRTDEFKSSLKEHHFDIKNVPIINNNFYAQDGYDGVVNLINSDKKFDSIIAINDRVAQGSIRAIKDLMGDNATIAVVSLEHFSENDFNIPRITSVDHNINDLSILTVQHLKNLLSTEPDKLKDREIIPKLIIGESC